MVRAAHAGFGWSPGASRETEIERPLFDNAVRLWDADKGTTPGAIDSGCRLPDKAVRQAAVRHVGEQGLKSGATYRVVMSMGDGKLRLWHAENREQNQGIKTVPAARNSTWTAALAPGAAAQRRRPPHILTADPGINVAKVRAWETTAGLPVPCKRPGPAHGVRTPDTLLSSRPGPGLVRHGG